jgi:hypothetical protein
MKILAFMQNQWFHDPERIKALMERYQDQRNSMIARFLFATGNKSGNRLRSVFGETVNQIIWEEASSQLGDRAGSVFPADLEHMVSAIAKHQPEVIVCFGRIASDGIRKLLMEDRISESIRIFYGPHPSARQSLADLRSVVEQINGVIGGLQTSGTDV